MTDIEKFIALAGFVGVIWVALARNQGTAPGNSYGMSQATTVPWYLQYNTLPPVPAGFTNGGTITTPSIALPSNASGMENTNAVPCSTCSMFGASFGSQY